MQTASPTMSERARGGNSMTLRLRLRLEQERHSLKSVVPDGKGKPSAHQAAKPRLTFERRRNRCIKNLQRHIHVLPGQDQRWRPADRVCPGTKNDQAALEAGD